MEEKARAWWAIINTVAAYIWQGHNTSTTEKSCFSRTTRWTATFKRTVFPKPSHARITGLAQKLKPTLLSVILVIHTSWMSQFLNEAGSDKKKKKKTLCWLKQNHSTDTNWKCGQAKWLIQPKTFHTLQLQYSAALSEKKYPYIIHFDISAFGLFVITSAQSSMLRAMAISLNGPNTTKA